MVIAKTASRNVAFKVARMRDAIMQDQDEFITRDTNFEDVALVANDRANLEDVGSALIHLLIFRNPQRKFDRYMNFTLPSETSMLWYETPSNVGIGRHRYL